MIASRIDPPSVRKGWLIAGLTLICISVPLVFVLGAMTLVVSTTGALVLTYALLPSGYPLLGMIASFAVAFAVPSVVLKLLIG